MMDVRRTVTAIVLAACALTAVTAPGLAAGGNVAAISDGFPLMPYAADGTPAPWASTEGGAYLVRVTDAAGKFVGAARWDGKTVARQNDQPGWAIPLIAWTGSNWLQLEIGVSETDHSVVFLNVTSDPLVARDYRYSLAFAGRGAWVATGDGNMTTAAVRSSAQGSSEDLADFLALSTDYPGVSFASRLHKTEGRPDVHYVESTAKPTMDAPKSPRLLTAHAAGVECWSHEPVLAAAAAMTSAEARPDVRVFANVDKQAARPGDILTYTYYLFNAGVQAADKLSASFDMPAGSAFIEGSVRGDPAAVSFINRADGEVESIAWAPENRLEFGKVFRVSFSVTVR